MKKDVKGKVKKWLLGGHTLTQNQALRMMHTSRLAVYINRLRKELKIKTEMVRAKNGDIYAKYSIEL